MSKKKTDSRAPRRRVGARLLVLLWIWAGCIALVLDLFLNVEKFDGVRPRAALYRGMREVAHKMVGEPILEREATAVVQRPAKEDADAREELALREVPSSRHPGGKPDAGTPQGRKLMDHLVAAARGEEDTERREAALRSLAGMFGTEASEELSGIADDPAQPAEIREVAANLGRRNTEGSK
ncbi:MAG: hypothetical protein ACT4PV_11850 [Planctomycetaceae bacterium]